MSTEVTISHTPADKTTGITIDEMGAFLQEVHRAGIAGGTRVAVTVGFRSQITKVEVKG